MIVVLDTNVIVSGLITPGGDADRILKAAAAGRFRIAMTQHLQEELLRATRYRHLRKFLIRQWERRERSIE